MERLPQMEPDRCRSQCYKENAEHFDQLECVLMIVFLAVTFLEMPVGKVRMLFVLAEGGCGFVGDGHQIS